MAAAPGVVTYNRINPLSVMQILMQYQGQKRAAKAREDQGLRAERDKAMDYSDKFNAPVTKFDAVNNAYSNDVNVLMTQGTRQYLNDHPNDFRGAEEYSKRTGRYIMDLGHQINTWKGALDDQEKILRDGISNGYIKEDAISKHRDIYTRPDGSPKISQATDGSTDWSELRASMADSEKIFDDPTIYDVDGLIRYKVGQIKDKKQELISDYKGYPGRTPDLLVQTLESGLDYMRDPKNPNRYLVDDNMKPVPLINEEWLKFFRTDADTRLVLDTYGGKTPEEQIQFLQKKVLSEYDQPKFDQSIVKGNEIDQTDRRYYAFGSGFRFPIADLEDRDNRLEQIVTKNRPDLLSGVSDPSSDLGAFYGNKEGKPIGPGQKPETIVLLHSGRLDGADQNLAEQIANTDDIFAKMALMQKAGIGVKPEVYSIGSDEDKRKTKIALSLRLDKLDTKRSIGEEYSNYVEAKRKSQTGSIAQKMKAAAQKK